MGFFTNPERQSSWRTYSIEVADDFLIVATNGNRGETKVDELTIAMWNDIERQCQDYHVNRVMVVSNVKGELSDKHSQNVADHLSRINNERQYRIALVDLQFSSYLTNLTAAQKAIKKGVAIQVFHTEAEGRNWIQS